MTSTTISTTTTTLLLRCVACQLVESELIPSPSSGYGEEESSSTYFISLAPCQHTMCSECFNSPMTLVSCFGCPACGVVPESHTRAKSTISSTTTTAATTTQKKKMSNDVESSQGMTSTLSTTSTTFSPSATTADSMYYYNFSSSPSMTFDTTPSYSTDVANYTVTPTPMEYYGSTVVVPVVSGGMMDEDEYVEEEEEEGSSSEEEEEEEEESSSIATITTATENETPSIVSTTSVGEKKKRRRQRKKTAEERNSERWTYDATPPKAPTVHVPSGTPDHLRPKRKPDPTTCREAGRREERTKALRKVRKDKNKQMERLNNRTLRGMACI